MFVGCDVKWYPVSGTTTFMTLKRPFFWISMKSRLVRVNREASKFHNLSSNY